MVVEIRDQGQFPDADVMNLVYAKVAKPTHPMTQ